MVVDEGQVTMAAVNIVYRCGCDMVNRTRTVAVRTEHGGWW